MLIRSHDEDPHAVRAPMEAKLVQLGLAASDAAPVGG